MKRILKILLGLLGGAVLLLILAGVLLPLVYDKDDLKQAISAQVHRQTGRELRIGGDLDFSVFPWLAVEVGDLSLSNAAGFGDQPFATIGKARVGVALLPLFKKQLVADEITLDGLHMALAVNASGKNNWEDLGGQTDDRQTTASATPETGAGLFASQSIAGLNIRDAQIDYQDQQAKAHYRMSDFSMQTGTLGGVAPVPVELKMLLEDVSAKSRLEVDLSTTAALDLPAKNYTLDDVVLALRPLTADGPDPKAGNGEAVTIRAPRLEANMASQTVTLETFTASIAGLQASGHLKASKVLSKPAFDGALQVAEFSPRKLMQALSLETPVTADPNALQNARLGASLHGNASQLNLDDFKLELDQSQFSGQASVRNFDRPAVRFDFTVDAIDLDRYMEPAGKGAGTQTDVSMPREALQDLDLQGSLRVGALHVGGLHFSDAVVGLQLKNGKLVVNPLTAGFYDGKYSGNITLDSSAATPLLSVDEKLDSVTFQRLLADITENRNLSGTAQGHVRLTGRGATSSEVLGSLKGDVGLTLAEGALEGVNVWYEIRRGYALYKGLTPPEPEPARTVFSRMQLSAAVDKGVLTTRELAADLPFLSLRGDGAVDLAKSGVDLHLTAAVRNVPELARDPLGAELKGMQLPFKVKGSLTDPKVSVDWAKLMKSEATGMLLDKLGLKQKSEPEQPAENAEQKESSKDQTKEAAKGMLFDLLRGKDKSEDKSADKQEQKSDGG